MFEKWGYYMSPLKRACKELYRICGILLQTLIVRKDKGDRYVFNSRTGKSGERI